MNSTVNNWSRVVGVCPGTTEKQRTYLALVPVILGIVLATGAYRPCHSPQPQPHNHTQPHSHTHTLYYAKLRTLGRTRARARGADERATAIHPLTAHCRLALSPPSFANGAR